MNIVSLINDQYVKLKNDRYKDWFGSFLAHTNQKKQSAELLKSVISVLLGNRVDCKIFDVGAGEGTLAKNIVGVLKANCDNIHYSGLELIESYAVTANKTLQSLNISLVNIQQGDFSNKSDLLKMPDDADIILASHVAYYAQNITEFVFNLIPFAKANTKLVFIHQSMYSKASEFRDVYRLNDAPASHQEALRKALESQGFEVKELYYPAYIEFPKDIVISDVINDVLARRILSPQAQTVRNLLEFILHVPLEYLRDRNELKDFTEIITKILKDQENYFILWDVFQIATRHLLGDIKTLSAPMERQSTQERFEYKALNLKDFEHINNFWTFSPIEIACYMGNLGIVRQLKSQLNKEIPFRGLCFASGNGHIKLVEELLEIKDQIDLDIRSENGRTALHSAAYFDHPYIVSLLLSTEINLRAEDNDGQTALDLAVRNCNVVITEILWNHTSFEELGAQRTLSLYHTLYQECSRRSKIEEARNLGNILHSKIGSVFADCHLRLAESFAQLKKSEKSDDELLQQLTLISESKECKGLLDVEGFLTLNKQPNPYYYGKNLEPVESENVNANGKNVHQHQDEL